MPLSLRQKHCSTTISMAAYESKPSLNCPSPLVGHLNYRQPTPPIFKRGSPLEPEGLKRSLRLRGPKENHCILFLTHVLGEAVVEIN